MMMKMNRKWLGMMAVAVLLVSLVGAPAVAQCCGSCQAKAEVKACSSDCAKSCCADKAKAVDSDCKKKACDKDKKASCPSQQKAACDKTAKKACCGTCAPQAKSCGTKPSAPIMYPDCPSVLIAKAKGLGLCPKQVATLEVILATARKQSLAVLSPEQVAKLKGCKSACASAEKSCATACGSKKAASGCASACAKSGDKPCAKGNDCCKVTGKACDQACSKSAAKSCASACGSKKTAAGCASTCAKSGDKPCAKGKDCCKVTGKACDQACSKTATKSCASACGSKKTASCSQSCSKSGDKACTKSCGQSSDCSTCPSKIDTLQKTCPIMGLPINKKLSIDYKGKKVFFCCPGCVKQFKKNPKKYEGKLPQFK